MIDIAKIKHGAVVKINDGTQGVVKGSYMSIDGLVLRVLQTGGIVQRNVPLKNVTDVVDGPNDDQDPNGTVTSSFS